MTNRTTNELTPKHFDLSAAALHIIAMVFMLMDGQRSFLHRIG